MKINQITVVAGRCFNHPYESYSNLQPSVTLIATLEDGDDPNKASKHLQQQAETLVEDHKQAMLRSIHELQMLTDKKQRLQSLGETIRRNAEEIDNIRAQYPELALELK